MKYYFQVELLLGKAYSDWGHVSDAVSIYDQLISNHPDDFRGYLAKVHVVIWFTYHVNDSLPLQPSNKVRSCDACTLSNFFQKNSGLPEYDYNYIRPRCFVGLSFLLFPVAE